jgi:hypothetical protein
MTPEPAPDDGYDDTEYGIVVAGHADLYGRWEWRVTAPLWSCCGAELTRAEMLPAAVAALVARERGQSDV